MELAPEPELIRPYVPVERGVDPGGASFIVLEDDSRYPDAHLPRCVDLMRARYPKSVIFVTTCRMHATSDPQLVLRPLKFEDMKRIWQSLFCKLTPEQEYSLFQKTGGNPRMGVIAAISVRDRHTTIEHVVEYLSNFAQEATTRAESYASNGSEAPEVGSPSPAVRNGAVTPTHTIPGEILDLTPRRHGEDQYTAKAYREELHTVEDLLGIAVKISGMCGGIMTSTRFIRAAQLYTRLVITLRSFVRLLPENKITNDREPFWDWGSVAAVARILVEIYHGFYYIGVEKLSEDEIDFRLGLMQLHLNSEKYRLYKEWGADRKVLGKFEVGLPKDRQRVKNTKFFNALPREKQSDLLKGKGVMHLSRQEIADRSNVLGTHFKPLYRLFSNQAHATPFAFQSQSNIRGRGLENPAERGYIMIAIQVVIRYISRAILEMAEIFPEEIKTAEAPALKKVSELLEESATLRAGPSGP